MDKKISSSDKDKIKAKKEKKYSIRFINNKQKTEPLVLSADDALVNYGHPVHPSIVFADDNQIKYFWNYDNSSINVRIGTVGDKKEIDLKKVDYCVNKFELDFGKNKNQPFIKYQKKALTQTSFLKFGLFVWEQDELYKKNMFNKAFNKIQKDDEVNIKKDEGDINKREFETKNEIIKKDLIAQECTEKDINETTLNICNDNNNNIKNVCEFIYENDLYIQTYNQKFTESNNNLKKNDQERVYPDNYDISTGKISDVNEKSDLDVEYSGSSEDTNHIIDNLTKIKKEFKRVEVLEEKDKMLFFIDKCIECKDNIADIQLDIKLCPNTYNVNLGSRIYSVKKYYHDSDQTVFEALLSFCVLSDDLQNFMNSYKVLQITGTIIHPLTKIKEVSSVDKYVIVTNITNIGLGIDSDIFKDRKILGLKNLGNTCFMNSSLQSILNCKEFSDFFYSCDSKKLAVKKKLSASFCELVKEFDSKDEFIAPLNFKRTLGSKVDIYNDKSEQDAMEFITDMLDLIHEEIKIKNKVIKEDLDGYQKWQIENQSIVTNLFFCKIMSSIICSDCQNSRTIYEPCLYLPVPIPLKKEYNSNIVLFYDSPQRVPLKIFAERSLIILELKEYIKNEYNILNDLFCCTINNGVLIPLDDFTTIGHIKDTLFCYEYQQDKVHDYVWVKISKNFIFWTTYLEFFILVLVDKKFTKQNGEVNTDFLFEIVKSRLIPFIDQSKSNIFYENVSQLFYINYDYIDTTSSNLYNRSQIRLQISHNNFIKLFGYNFNPIKQMVHLIFEKIDIKDCINNFLVREYIFGDDKQLCEGCSQYTIHYKDSDIVKFPKYLIVQLKRFRFTGIDFEKIDTIIDFSLDSFYIKNHKYKVISIINHITPSCGFAFRSVGSNGHYTAYVRYKDDWFLCNDQIVTKVKNIEKSNAYIFILERIE